MTDEHDPTVDDHHYEGDVSDSIQGDDGDEDGRYRAIEYHGTDGTVTIIQDSENSRAWLQSDYTLRVRE